MQNNYVKTLVGETLAHQTLKLYGHFQHESASRKSQTLQFTSTNIYVTIFQSPIFSLQFYIKGI